MSSRLWIPKAAQKRNEYRLERFNKYLKLNQLCLWRRCEKHSFEIVNPMDSQRKCKHVRLKSAPFYRGASVTEESLWTFESKAKQKREHVTDVCGFTFKNRLPHKHKHESSHKNSACSSMEFQCTRAMQTIAASPERKLKMCSRGDDQRWIHDMCCCNW